MTRDSLLVGALVFLLAGACDALAADEGRIPAFARRYGVSCNLCHNPIPALSAFGEQFAANGFRFAAGERMRDSVPAGDPLMSLMRELPLAIRLDAYAQLYADGRAATDLQMPYNLKVLSGGPISDNISYYFYFFLFERGEVGGIEDAYLYFNDVGGLPVDVAVGQFQVSDPLFKRELRLTYQDYAIYRARVGDQPADFTYDRGVMVIADFAGFTISGEIVNGNGRVPAGSNRRLDDDAGKSFVAHLSREILPGFRLGALGYRGSQTRDLGEQGEIRNRLWMLGGDATISGGPLELNLQYVYRKDDRPTFQLSEPEAVTQGGFAELLVRPPGSRWYAVGLYNRVWSDRPLLDVRLGGPGDVTRYETFTAGGGYQLRRNVRLFLEATWDRERDQFQLSLGTTAAF
ncbi:hypothetical protein HRbin33_00787 [bacterium HR33]|nr:hypothetical protein HRbin33_00787 [bacterium HR33]